MSRPESGGGEGPIVLETVDRSRCVLCGGPNDCALAQAGADEDEAAEPCWCVGREFPTVLVDRATRRDGGASCICRSCLDASHPDESDA